MVALLCTSAAALSLAERSCTSVTLQISLSRREISHLCDVFSRTSVTLRDGYRQSLFSHLSRDAQFSPQTALVIYGQSEVGGRNDE